jgi:PAB-dependent poly(A)-specific ribonuclease subunit 3
MVPVFRGGCMYMVPEVRTCFLPPHKCSLRAVWCGVRVSVAQSEAEAYAGGDGDVDPTAAVVSSEEMLALNPEVIPGGPRRRTFRSMFMPDSLYEHYLSQSRMLLAKVEPADPRYKELPPTYTCMLPLDNEAKTRGATGTLGYVTALYKVIDRNDGLAYCVRRVDYVRAHHQVTHQAQKRWANVSHPGIVQLRSCFVYTSAILFVHDYHPGARTLREAFIASPSTPLTESTLWSFACQLAAAIQCVHLREMCFRAVHIDKILMTGHNRVRISSSGLLDVLEAESQVSLADNQVCWRRLVGKFSVP